MEIELFWGLIALVGIVLSIRYRISFKNFVGPVLVGFTGALWIAYIFG